MGYSHETGLRTEEHLRQTQTNSHQGAVLPGAAPENGAAASGTGHAPAEPRQWLVWSNWCLGQRRGELREARLHGTDGLQRVFAEAHDDDAGGDVSLAVEVGEAPAKLGAARSTAIRGIPFLMPRLASVSLTEAAKARERSASSNPPSKAVRLGE